MYFTDQNKMQRGDSTKLNLEGLEMQKWNIPTDRARRADEKNGVICQLSWLFWKLWSLKCQEWVYFCIFCWWQQNISHSLWKRFKRTWKIFSFLSESSMVNSLCCYCSRDIEDRNIKKLLSQQWNKEILYLQQLTSC